MSLIDEYFDYQDNFEKNMELTQLFLEVGSFFEVYGTDDVENNKGRIEGNL